MKQQTLAKPSFPSGNVFSSLVLSLKTLGAGF
jgi:hypothetical protein